MARARLARIFWIGAAATLVVAALIGVAGILRSEFTETDGKTLLTLVTLLVGAGTAVAGLSLVERSTYQAFGWFSAVVGAFSFVVITVAIWQDFENEPMAKAAGTAAAILVATLLMSTQMLLHRGRLTAVVVATWLCLSLAALGTTLGIWSEESADELWKFVGALSVLGLLGWLLVPVLQRFTAAGAVPGDVRVLGELDGIELVATRSRIEGVAVDPPQAGERLVLRRQG